MIESLFLHSTSGRRPLRVGVLLDDPYLSRPFADIFEHIQRSNFARLEVVVFNAGVRLEPPGGTPVGLAGKIKRLLSPEVRPHLLYSLYERWDASECAEANRLLGAVDCSSYFTDVKQLTVVPITKRFVHRFPPEAIKEIQGLDLDVILRFGFNILRGEILQIPRYGVWSYHHGDNDFYRGGPAHFWELYEDSPVSGVMLQVLSERLDDGLVLCKALTSTEQTLFVSRNRVAPYLTGATFVIRKLHELHQYGWEHVTRKALPPAPYRGGKPIYRTPTNMEMVRYLVPKLVRKTLQYGSRRDAIMHWRVAIREGRTSLAEPGAAADGFRWIESPAEYFYADPFLLERDSRLWMFFEKYLYAEERGVIACSEILAKGELSDPVTVLDTTGHLSYPAVFEHEDNVFMIPESGLSGRIELYRASAFPFQWEKVRTLYELSAVDTTPVFHDGRFWFFVTSLDPPESSYQLLLFSSDEVAGEWIPHPANPLSMDVRHARGAGAILNRQGQLIRPSQNGSPYYGRSIGFHRINTLNTLEYQEHFTHQVEPSLFPGVAGVHSYGAAGRFEVIDGQHKSWLRRHRPLHTNAAGRGRARA